MQKWATNDSTLVKAIRNIVGGDANNDNADKILQ